MNPRLSWRAQGSGQPRGPSLALQALGAEGTPETRGALDARPTLELKEKLCFYPKQKSEKKHVLLRFHFAKFAFNVIYENTLQLKLPFLPESPGTPVSPVPPGSPGARGGRARRSRPDDRWDPGKSMKLMKYFNGFLELLTLAPSNPFGPCGQVTAQGWGS